MIVILTDNPGCGQWGTVVRSFCADGREGREVPVRVPSAALMTDWHPARLGVCFNPDISKHHLASQSCSARKPFIRWAFAHLRDPQVKRGDVIYPLPPVRVPRAYSFQTLES